MLLKRNSTLLAVMSTPKAHGLTESGGRASASVLRAALVGAAREAREAKGRQPTSCQRVLPARERREMLKSKGTILEVRSTPKAHGLT